MEAEDSSHSLLSRRQTEELGSHYVTESGVYMSSFAATIFVAGLVTIGVLTVTMLVALTVMLSSCQNSSSGIIERFRSNDNHDYCYAFAFHAELNNLEANEFPAMCNQYNQHSQVAKFLTDLNLTVQLAENYFSNLKANDDCMDVILMDVDDIFIGDFAGSISTKEWEHTASAIRLRLFSKLQGSGLPLIIFSRRHSSSRNETLNSLISAGYSGWTSLIMRSDEEVHMESWEYLWRHRLDLVEQGYRIASVISSQADAFRGSYIGVRNFKLANAKYFTI